MKNEMNHAEVAENLNAISGQFENAELPAHFCMIVNDVNTLRQASEDERRIANGELIEMIHAHWVEKTTPWNMGCEKYLACSNCGGRQCDTYENSGNKFCDSCGALLNGKDDNND